MSNDIINYAEHSDEFYPTPAPLVERMLAGVDWDYVKTILEPSAGKGDILKAIATHESGRYSSRNFDVDAIEIDANLRQILKHNFSEEREREYVNGDASRRYGSKPFFNNGIHIVYDDFLTYKPFKTYDLIVMNPPFSNGDEHLLKALDVQKRGGTIICLLNAETIRNPYTEKRRELLRLLNEYEAQIEFISDAFSKAERRTDVEVALVEVSIPRAQEPSEFYERMKKAEDVDDNFGAEACTDLDVTDYLKSAVQHYNVEVKAGIELIRQFRAFQRYMTRAVNPKDKFDSDSILRLTDSRDRGYDSISINDYLKLTRLKYWKALLSNPQFTGRLTSKLQQEYQEKVNTLADYDFNEFNIRTLSLEMMSHVKSGIEDEIIAMFDRLTDAHSWYPECAKNRHYYDGWSTNKAWKVNKKVIIPTYGVWSEWDGRPRVYEAEKVLADIERIMNFFSAEASENVALGGILETHFKNGVTKNVPLKHFTATFYKKGTVHLVFNDERLLERFNIYVAQGKNNLPPSYGKKRYKDMTEREQRIIDEFQGEAKYEEVLRDAQYYLASPVKAEHIMMLTAPTE